MLECVRGLTSGGRRGCVCLQLPCLLPNRFPKWLSQLALCPVIEEVPCPVLVPPVGATPGVGGGRETYCSVRFWGTGFSSVLSGLSFALFPTDLGVSWVTIQLYKPT